MISQTIQESPCWQTHKRTTIHCVTLSLYGR